MAVFSGLWNWRGSQSYYADIIWIDNTAVNLSDKVSLLDGIKRIIEVS